METKGLLDKINLQWRSNLDQSEGVEKARPRVRRPLSMWVGYGGIFYVAHMRAGLKLVGVTDGTNAGVFN